MSEGDDRSAGRIFREMEGRPVVFDNEGFFDDPDHWSEATARLLAGEMGLQQLTEAHWRVLRFLRDFYFQNGRAPLNKALKDGVGISIREIEALFPEGIKYGARRLAGLPNPKSCM